MNDLLIELAGVAGVTWAATEGIGRAINWGKEKIALVLGPVVGLSGQAAGLIHAGEGWQGLVAAGVYGFVATLAAGAAHDYLAKPAAAALMDATKGLGGK